MLDDRGIRRAIRIEPDILVPLGLQFNARVHTPKGCGSVMGVHDASLYVLLDANRECEQVTGFLLKEIEEDPTQIQPVEECAPAATRGVEHRVKQVVFSCQCFSAVMQGRNGPCPVLALANALLLAGRLKLNQSSADRISAAELQNALAAYLWTKPALPTFLHSPSELTNPSSGNTTLPTIASVAADAARLEEMRRSLLGKDPDEGKAQEVLAHMYDGLDVDPIFANEESFVGDNAVLLFALAGVRLLHGWVLPRDGPFAPLHELSFNQLTDLVASVTSPVGASAAEAPPEKSAEDQELQRMAAAFYEETSVHQMTEAGLRALEEAVDEREVVVLFRRNHFFTLTKLNGRLLALCSDENFVDKSTFVFSRLDNIAEDGNFTDGEGVDTDPLLSYIQACTGSEFSEESIYLCRGKLQAKAVADSLPIESVTHEQVLRQLKDEKEAAARGPKAERTGGEMHTAAVDAADEMTLLGEKVKQFCDVFPDVGEEAAINKILDCQGSLERAVQAQLEQL